MQIDRTVITLWGRLTKGEIKYAKDESLFVRTRRGMARLWDPIK
jgi:hypothetical protein